MNDDLIVPLRTQVNNPFLRIMLEYADEDPIRAWTELIFVESKYRHNWREEMENYPQKWREIAELLDKAVEKWDKIVAEGFETPKDPQRQETYQRSIPHYIQYLVWRLYHLGRLSGIEKVKSCIVCGRPFWSFVGGTRFCSPRCYSLYHFFYRQVNHVIELTRARYYFPDDFQKCVGCDSALILWRKTETNTWVCDWAASLTHTALARRFPPKGNFFRDVYERIGRMKGSGRMSHPTMLCKWKAKLRAPLLETPQVGNPAELQKNERILKWLNGIETGKIPPNKNLLLAYLHDLVDAFDRTFRFLAFYAIILNLFPSDRYRLLLNKTNIYNLIFYHLYFPILLQAYQGFFAEVMVRMAECLTKALDGVIEEIEKSMTDLEYTPNIQVASVLEPVVAEAEVLIDKHGVERLGQVFDGKPDYNKLVEMMFKVTEEWVKQNAERLDAIRLLPDMHGVQDGRLSTVLDTKGI